MEAFFTLLLAAYIMTVGLGIMFNGAAGVAKVNKTWLKVTRRSIAWCLNTIAAFFRWVARTVQS